MCQPSHASIGPGCLERSLNRQLALRAPFFTLGTADSFLPPRSQRTQREDRGASIGNELEIYSRRSLRALRAFAVRNRLAFSKSPREVDDPAKPRLAGMPATVEARNGSNGRNGSEAENGGEWQSLAVFGQRVATGRACNRAAGLRSSRSSRHPMSRCCESESIHEAR